MPIIQTLSLPNQLNELALFAGAGGGILGGKLLGWRTVCAVEWDAYARDVLVARQNDGCLDPFPIWDDIQTFDGRAWRGCVDVVSGGFPCQDISSAGKGAGIEGERSGMWKHMARIIGEVRPRFVLVENSPMLVGRGLGMVLGHLAEMGYDARWGIVGAHHTGAPHKRDRIWIVANANGESGAALGASGIQTGTAIKVDSAGEQSSSLANASGPQDDSKWGDRECGRHAVGRNQQTSQRKNGETDNILFSGCGGLLADAGSEGLQGVKLTGALRNEREWTEAHGSTGECGGVSRSTICSTASERDVLDAESERYGQGGNSGNFYQENGGQNGKLPPIAAFSDWWATEPDVGRVAHGVAARVDRLRCIGNGQVSAVVPIAWSVCGDDEADDGKHERLACNSRITQSHEIPKEAD